MQHVIEPPKLLTALDGAKVLNVLDDAQSGLFTTRISAKGAQRPVRKIHAPATEVDAFGGIDERPRKFIRKRGPFSQNMKRESDRGFLANAWQLVKHLNQPRDRIQGSRILVVHASRRLQPVRYIRPGTGNPPVTFSSSSRIIAFAAAFA